MLLTLEHVGNIFELRKNGILIAAAFDKEVAINLFNLFNDDPTNDGPEVEIINREAEFSAEEF